MNMIENQVTDLNYLAESPLALSGSGNMNGQRQSSSAESPAENGAGSGKKRTSDDMTGNNSGGNGATHARAKRNRYISIAWYVQISPAMAYRSAVALGDRTGLDPRSPSALFPYTGWPGMSVRQQMASSEQRSMTHVRQLEQGSSIDLVCS